MSDDENLEELLSLSKDPVIIQPIHANWLQYYEDFLKANGFYHKLLSQSDKRGDDEQMKHSF